MKKVIIYMIVCAITMLYFLVIGPNGTAHEMVEDLKNTIAEAGQLKNDDIELYNSSITISNFVRMVENGEEKLYVLYDLTPNNGDYNLIAMVKNNGQIRTVQFVSKTENESSALRGISEFIDRNCGFFKRQFVSQQFQDRSGITWVDNVANAIIEIDFAPYGFITTELYLSEFDATQNSNLYI